MPLVIALLSGGLDSLLAIRVLQQQAIDLEALFVRTPFVVSDEPAAQAADQLGIPLTVVSVEEDYVELLRNPRFGFGKGANPCLDCHLYMVKMAGRLMQQHGARAVVTGDILGQRPMSQKRQDLDLIARRANLEGRLLRPLSAKLLDPTIPEQEGLIDREQLYEFSGRQRGVLIELAQQLGLKNIPSPSPGCALTETTFAPRVRDLFHFSERVSLWDCELLRVGRHFRIDPLHKVVLGRNVEDNEMLRSMAATEGSEQATLIEPEDFLGPDAILVGPATEASLRLAGGLMVGYTRQSDSNRQKSLICVRHGKAGQFMEITATAAAKARATYRPIART